MTTLKRDQLIGLSEELADLLVRIGQIHPSELPPSVRDLVDVWAATGYKVGSGEFRMVVTDKINHRLSDDDEVRRLRELLGNVERNGDFRQVRVATSVGKDGISLIVTCPNGDDEVDIAKAFAGMTWGLRDMLTHAFLEIARREHPDIFEDLLLTASEEVVELANVIAKENGK